MVHQVSSLQDCQIDWFNPKIGTPTLRISYYGIGLNDSAIKVLGNPKFVSIGCSSNILVVKYDNTGLPLNTNNNYHRINNKDLIIFVKRNLNLNMKDEKTSIKKDLTWDENVGGLVARFL